MSQSGIPVVSQVAGVVGNIAGGIGDIFAGKNVFESLGRIIVAPVAGALDLVNDLSFNSLAHTPGVGGVFSGGRDLFKNPYDAGAAVTLGKGLATSAAIAAGGLAAGGLLVGGSATALASASTFQTIGGIGALSGAAANRDLIGVANAGVNLASQAGVTAPSAVTDAVNAAKPLVGSLLPQVGSLAQGAPAAAAPAKAADYTTNNVNGPAQTYLAGFSSGQLILLLGGGAIIFYLAVK